MDSGRTPTSASSSGTPARRPGTPAARAWSPRSSRRGAARTRDYRGRSARTTSTFGRPRILDRRSRSGRQVTVLARREPVAGRRRTERSSAEDERHRRARLLPGFAGDGGRALGRRRSTTDRPSRAIGGRADRRLAEKIAVVKQNFLGIGVADCVSSTGSDSNGSAARRRSGCASGLRFEVSSLDTGVRRVRPGRMPVWRHGSRTTV